jgi:ATP-dependent protease ClpP protease subunit
MSDKVNISEKELNLEYSFNWGVDFERRVIRLSSEIEDGEFNGFDAALSEMESLSRKTITIRICSYGGSVYEALAVAGRIKRSPCKIITEGYGPVMSAATLILACGDERKLSRFSWFMHHAGSYEVEGTHTEIKHAVAQADRENKQWALLMQEFTGVEKGFWLSYGSDKDAYLDAEMCLKLKIVDKLI